MQNRVAQTKFQRHTGREREDSTIYLGYTGDKSLG